MVDESMGISGHYMKCDPDNEKYATVKQLDKFEIDYSGVFDMAHLYKSLHDYLVNDEGWTASDCDDIDDHTEYSYVENDIGDGKKSHNIWWRFKFKPDKSEYFMFMMHFNIQTVALSKTEIVKGDKKVSLDKGEVIFRGKLYYIHDFAGAWGNDKLLKKLTKKFKDIHYGDQIGHYKKDLLAFSIRLQSYIKYYLKMKTIAGNPAEQFAGSK